MSDAAENGELFESDASPSSEATESKVLYPLTLNRTNPAQGRVTSLSHWAFHVYPFLSLPSFEQHAPLRGKIPLNVLKYLPTHSSLRWECQLLNVTKLIHCPLFSLTLWEPPLFPYSLQSERPSHAPGIQARDHTVILLQGNCVLCGKLCIASGTLSPWGLLCSSVNCSN